MKGGKFVKNSKAQEMQKVKILLFSDFFLDILQGLLLY